jgi:hypothetical protein
MAQDYQKNQESIVRQSTLKFVGDYCKMIGTPLTLKEVVGVTNVLVDYCQNGYSKELGERLDKIDSHIKSLFEETI